MLLDQQRKHVLHALDYCFRPEERKCLEPLMRSSIRLKSDLVMDEHEIPLGASKLGGSPDLPPGIAWPLVDIPLSLLGEAPASPLLYRYIAPGEIPAPFRGQRQRALPFLCQVSLADAAPFDPEHVLPERGLLLFFGDPELDRWIGTATGEAPKQDWRAWKIIFLPDTTALQRVSPVQGLRSFAPCTLTCLHEWVLPASQNPVLPREFASHERYQECLALMAKVQGLSPVSPFHRLLGYDQPIEDDVGRELCALLEGASGSVPTPPLQLLLQLDSDRFAEMRWGDEGCLYLYVRADLAGSQRFGEVYGVQQQY